MKIYRLKIKIISPVHVGTGEVYEPTNFFVHAKEKYLGIIDFERFCHLISNSDLDRFTKLCREGTINALVRLYDFMDSKCLALVGQGIDGFIIRKIALCNGFLRHYERLKSLSGDKLQREFNRFTIYRNAFSPNSNQPILPGSAIKGAIRTAVLNLRRQKAKGSSWKDYCQGKKCDSKQLESDILEYPKFKFQNDPFRLLKISDFSPVGKVDAKVMYAVNYKKQGFRARGPYQIFEVIEPGAVFEGKITLLEPQRNSGIRTPLSFDEILQALEDFYGKEKARESDEIRGIGADFPTLPQDGFPLCLGRHSGAECVTVKGFRRIKIMGPGRQAKFFDHATTLWLVSDEPRPQDVSRLKPFGWAVILGVSDEDPSHPHRRRVL